MRFLADENVEQVIVASLRREGHDVVYVTEAAPGATDRHVLSMANAERRLLLTNDKDFGELAYRESWVSQGIVLLRLPGGDGAAKAARLLEVLSVAGSRLDARFTVVTSRRVRLRLLHSKGT